MEMVEVDAMCSGEVNDGLNQILENDVITKSMIDEENKLNQITTSETSQNDNKFTKNEKKEALEKKYKQLQKLLQRSKFYTNYLSEKIMASKSQDLPESPGSKRRKLSPLKPLHSNYQESLSEPIADTKDCVVVLKDCMTDVVKENECGNKKRQRDQDPDVSSSSESKAAIQHPMFFTGGVMRRYQLEGYNWMRVLFENGLNGILGDEMGLGKTVQSIALIAHLVEMGVSGPFLICAPLSTLSNWINEFKRFTPLIPVIIYHGSKSERMEKLRLIKNTKIINDYASFPVVITSYEIIIKDVGILKRYKWKYLIVDEAQRIKNMRCLLITNLKQLGATNRLLLTGTPLQNNLAELWSLLNFLLPELFHKLEIFESWFDVSSIMEEGSEKYIVEQEKQRHVIATMRQILEPFLLRRIKREVELDLPPKREYLVYAKFTAKQGEFYKAILDKTIASLLMPKKEEPDIVVFNPERELRSSKPTQLLRQDYSGPKMMESVIKFSYKNIVMDLRKCVNHPYLIEYPLDLATSDYRVDENIVKSSGKMLILETLLKKLIPNHKILIFSQMVEMLNIIQDFCDLRSYSYRRLDGTMSFVDRNEAIADFNSDQSISLFLISTRAGGLGLNLMAADTVIIYDSDWNPQADLQAMDRCHRIGQTKPVIIYRLVTENSIDDWMVKRAAAKRKLEKMIIRKESLNTYGFSIEELLELLKSNDHDKVTYANESQVIGDEELAVLLDRNFKDKDNTKALAHAEILENTDAEF